MEEKNDENKFVGHMKVTGRGLAEAARDLYSSPLTFLREAYQNSVDSGAKKLSITASVGSIT
ncbi:MAG: hypothetical protein ACP5T3_03515, partial [Candidatus Micrarchaeia archaeon]